MTTGYFMSDMITRRDREMFSNVAGFAFGPVAGTVRFMVLQILLLPRKLMRFATTRALTAWTLAAAAALTGCAPVGPNFKTPESPQAQRYTESPLAPQTASAATAAGSAQRYAPGGDIPADWWELFHSAALDKLVRMALADSPTLDAARAALVQAQENLNAQYAVLYPSVDAAAGVKRQQTTGASLGPARMRRSTCSRSTTPR